MSGSVMEMAAKGFCTYTQPVCIEADERHMVVAAVRQRLDGDRFISEFVATQLGPDGGVRDISVKRID